MDAQRGQELREEGRLVEANGTGGESETHRSSPMLWCTDLVAAKEREVWSVLPDWPQTTQ